MGLQITSSRLVVSGGCGPVSTGPDAGMGMMLTGESALGSSSSIIKTPFPFLLVVRGAMSSQLAELLVLRILFWWTVSPVEGVTELISGEDGVVCWQAPCLNRTTVNMLAMRIVTMHKSHNA